MKCKNCGHSITAYAGGKALCKKSPHSVTSYTKELLFTQEKGGEKMKKEKNKKEKIPINLMAKDREFRNFLMNTGFFLVISGFTIGFFTPNKLIGVFLLFIGIVCFIVAG